MFQSFHNLYSMLSIVFLQKIFKRLQFCDNSHSLLSVDSVLVFVCVLFISKAYGCM